jgi:hypothetical protein
MSNEDASVNRHDAMDVARASSPRRHDANTTTTTIEEVRERWASLVSGANDESMANAYDHEIIVNDDKNIVLRPKKPPTAPCSIAEITPIQEGGAPYDVISRNDDNKSTSDRTPPAGAAEMVTMDDSSIDRHAFQHRGSDVNDLKRAAAPALALASAPATAGMECAEDEEDEENARAVVAMGSSPPATTDESSNRRPIMAAYPIGCPVWFDVRESKSSRSSTTCRLVARAGMIKKSASFDASERIIEYVVETTGEGTTTTMTRIDEGEIAYAVRCPVLVTRIKDDGSTTKVVADHRDEDDDGGSTSDTMVGEIIDVTLAIRNGVRTFLYSILISMNDDDDEQGGGGGVLIERDVVPERVRYRFSLEALRCSIREVTSSSNSSSRRGSKRKGLGIRSDGGRHEPMRNGMPPSVEAKKKKKKKEEEEETSIVSLGRINVSIDAKDDNDTLPRRLVAPSRSRGWCTNSPPIVHHAARGTTQAPPPSLPTPSPGSRQHRQTHQGPAISKPVTINATAEHLLDVPCTSRSEVSDEWRSKHQRLPNQLLLPQVSGKKAQMIFPDKLHRILSTPVYYHVRR